MPAGILLAMNSSQSMIFMMFNRLLMQAPVLLVLIAGIAFSAALWRRAPRAATLAMLGCGLYFVTLVGGAMIESYLITAQMSRGASAASLGHLFMLLGIVLSVLRAAGIGLLLAGAFAQRPLEPCSGFEVATTR